MMNEIKHFILNALGGFAVFGILLVGGTLPALAAAAAGNASDAGVMSGASFFWFFKPEVIVSNTESEPVPVKTVDSDVTVVNSLSDPVHVKDVDKFERLPVHTDRHGTILDGQTGGGSGWTVPEGKRVVIKSVTAKFKLPNDGSTIQVPSIRVRAFLNDTEHPSQDSAWHTIPLTKTVSTNNHDYYTGAITTLIYFEHNEANTAGDILVEEMRENGTDGDAEWWVSLSGYMIDIVP